MLYDKRWDKQTKADPYTLESLIAWLEKQPRKKRYDYGCNGACMLAQYLTSYGFSNVNMGTYRFYHDNGEGLLPWQFNGIAAEGVPTCGAALKRARDVLACTERSRELMEENADEGRQL